MTDNLRDRMMKIMGGPAAWREPEWPPTTCAECGKSFKAGERIAAHSPELVWAHHNCPPEQPDD